MVCFQRVQKHIQRGANGRDASNLTFQAHEWFARCQRPLRDSGRSRWPFCCFEFLRLRVPFIQAQEEGSSWK
jgi:hypothetical protein